MDTFTFNTTDTLILSIVVLYLGNILTHRISILGKYSIPQAVTGGLLVSLVTLLIFKFGGPKIEFDLQLRDKLLLVFFSTIGLSAKFSQLKKGGRPMLILMLCTSALLVAQNFTGVMMAKLFGAQPAYGLFAGSISFAGGHGTAIAWAQEAEGIGLQNAELIGIAFATFGLIGGGIIGGPVAEFMIKRNRFQSADASQDRSMMGVDDAVAKSPKSSGPVTMGRTLETIMTLAICVSFGDLVNRLFFDAGMNLPGFLTAMMIGIAITNLATVVEKEIRQPDFDKIGEVALQLFLSMSLMSMDLNAVTQIIGVVFIVLIAQMIVITLFAVFIVFRLMGKDYDATVICAGFTGLGLGATPVAIANMNAITSKYGPSLKAFLIVPVVGAFFLSLVNVLVIKLFMELPILN